MNNARDDLERWCRDLLRTSPWGDNDGTPVTLVEREIALTLDHIERLRRQDQCMRREFLDRQSDIESRVINLHPLPHHYLSHHWLERNTMINQLTNVLVRIEEHHRRAVVDYDKRLQTLHDHLLQLLNMHEQVREHNGHSRNSP